MSAAQSDERMNWLARAMAYIFQRVRPPLHVAVHVIYWSFIALLTAWLSVFVYLLFGERRIVDYELLGYFCGPLGIGSLAYAMYDASYADRASPWVGTGIFGAVSGYVFWVLVEMKRRERIDHDTGVLVAMGVALLFVLMRWLILKEQSSRAA